MNQLILENLPHETDPNQNKSSSLFEQSTSTLKDGNDSRDIAATMTNFIIFDEKQRSEIDAIDILPNEEEFNEEKDYKEDDKDVDKEDDKDDEKILDTSIIELEQNLELEEDSKDKWN